MSSFHLTHKQLLELRFWIEEHARDGYAAECAKLPLYMRAFGLPGSLPGWVDGAEMSVCEIGSGPYWGLLQYLRGHEERMGIPTRLVAVDTLFPAFDAAGILEHRGDIARVDDPFEAWETNEQFGAIITTNALDHGEMGFYLLPKIWRMIKPGGKFFCHVHLRSSDLLNLVHDHALTREQMEQHLSYTTLECERMTIYPADIDGRFCESLVGVWSKPK